MSNNNSAAIIVCGSIGMGYAVAEQLFNKSNKVVIIARSTAKLNSEQTINDR